MPDTFPPPVPAPPLDPSRPSRPAAAWLAITGASLLLVAAVVVVASRWQQIPQMLRFTGLLTALVMIAALAEQIRRSAPTTATVIAYLVPGVAITVGIAAGATLTRPWPTCILIGGVLGAAATEAQKRRWASPRMAILSAAGAILAACGIAAQSGVPAAILVAGAAFIVLMCGRTLEATTMALAVGASPVLAMLTTFKVGDGTMVRIGAAGPAVAWSAPIAGLVAAGVLGIVAHRRRSLAWAGVAVSCAVVNLVTGLAVGGAPAPLWACMIPLAVIAVELGAEASQGVWRELSVRASRHIALPASYLGLIVAPPVVIWCHFASAAQVLDWSLPLALGALATAFVAARRVSADPSTADTAIASSVGCAVAATAALAAPSLAVSGVAIVGLAFCFLVCRPSYVRATLVSFGYVSLTVLQRAGTDHWTAPTAIDLALACAAGLLCADVLLRRNVVHERAALVVVAVTGALLATVAPDWRLTMATAGVAVVGWYCIARRPQLAVPVAAMTAASAFLQIDDVRWSAVASAVIAGAVAVAWRRAAVLRLVAGAQFVLAAWLAVRVAEATPDGLVGWMIVTAIVLTGIAFSTPSVTELDAAGITATALAGMSLSAPGVHPTLISLTVIVASAQGLAYGVAQRRSGLAAGSAGVGVVGLLSLWFTTGTNVAVLSALSRYGFTGADLVALTVGTAMLFMGLAIRRWLRVSSWLAYGPGLAQLSAWIGAVETERRADWATMAGLLIGIAAIAVGGWRRLSAPLVVGTCLLTATVVIASGTQLASLPGWSWLVLGGVALLSLAAMIERRSKDDTDGIDGLKAMFERFG